MTNVLIYGGLGTMLAGALFGIYVAVTGMRESHSSFFGSLRGNMFGGTKPSPRMRHLIVAWAAVMLAGLALTGAGIAISI